MPDNWISVAEAISKLARARSLEPQKAVIPLFDLARDGKVQSRVASIIDGMQSKHRRNVPMNQRDWDDIINLESDDWYRHGTAFFNGDQEWIGIQINAHDLDAYFVSLVDQSQYWVKSANSQKAKEPKRKRPGPAPHPLWPEAIDTISRNCANAGYRMPLQHGERAAIEGMLLDFMAVRGKIFSRDTARKYAKQVIEKLPVN